MKYLILVLLSFFLVSCQPKEPSAQEIVDKAIEVSGGERYKQFDLEFDFRDKHYRVKRDNGLYRYERHFKDSLGNVKDIVTNDGFERYINDTLVKVADSMAFKYTNSVNSVQYFILLPHGLNDPAVNKTYLGKSNVKGIDYHKVKITFQQEGGGKDFEDVFVYWINADNFKVDYLAYSYITDGGGMRFREAYNERYIGGIRFVDYNNYKPKNKDIPLEDLAKALEEGSLELLSKIENENITVD